MDQFLIDRMVLQICPALNDPGSHRDQRRHPRGWVFLSTDVKKRKYLQKGANDKCSKLVWYPCFIYLYRCCFNGNALASWRTCFRCSLKAEIRQSCWGHRSATENLQLLVLKGSQGSVTRWGLGPIGAASWNMRMLLGIKTVKVCVEKTDGDLYISLMLQSLLQVGFGYLNSCSKTIWSTRVLHSNYSWLKYCFKLRKVL